MKLNVSVSPHIHSAQTSRSIMLDVIIALLPATVAGAIIFGLRVLAVVGVCVAASVLAEFLFNLACKKKQSIGDLSAVVTGLLLALNLPASIPLWQGAVGSIFAIIFVKCLFGGIGRNFANPAITARIFMLISFSGAVAKATFPKSVDTVSSATPLAVLDGLRSGANVTPPEIKDLLLGTRAGALGETCIIALVAGGIYLIAKKVITWHTPLAFIVTTYLFSLIVTGDAIISLTYILSGGLFLGAIFMATDYATTPTTYSGKLIFGVGCGIITCVIRFWGSYPEGVSFAILLMNIVTPYIDKLTAKKHFGGAV